MRYFTDPARGFRELPPSGWIYFRLLVGVAALLMLLIMSFLLYRHLRLPGVVSLKTDPVAILKWEELHSPGDRPMTIQLKGLDCNNGQFIAMPAVIYQSKIRLNQMKQAVLAYLQGPRTGRVQVCGPSDIVLNELYLSPDGTAVVDLSLGGSDTSGFGFWEETLFVRGLLFVLNNHFPEAKRVRLLMDGQESGTLAGHYALGLPASSYARPGNIALPE